MRRLSAVVMVLALALAPACAQASPQERIAQAAEKTSAAESARMAMSMNMTGGAQELTISAEGALEFPTQKMTMTMDLGDMGAQMGIESMEMISDGETLYMKFPNHEQLQLPTPWMKVNLAEAAGIPGMESLTQMNNNDPSKSMEVLRGVSDEVEEVGTEDVRGTSTTHYKTTIDIDKALEEVPEDSREDVEKMFDTFGAETIPMEIWLDEDGLLRRQKLTLDLTQVEGAAAAGPDAPTEMVMDFELYEFGAPVDVQPPPASEVTDFKDIQPGAGG